MIMWDSLASLSNPLGVSCVDETFDDLRGVVRDPQIVLVLRVLEELQVQCWESIPWVVPRIGYLTLPHDGQY